MNFFTRIIVALLSAGWIVPLYFAGAMYLIFMQIEVWPRLLGEHPNNSLVFTKLSTELLAIAAGWLFLVVVAWVFVLTRPNPQSAIRNPQSS